MKPEAPRSAGGGVAGGPVSPSMSRARRARVGDKDHIHGTVCATWFSSHLSPPARHPFRSRRRSSFLPLCSHGILDSSSAPRSRHRSRAPGPERNRRSAVRSGCVFPLLCSLRFSHCPRRPTQAHEIVLIDRSVSARATERPPPVHHRSRSARCSRCSRAPGAELGRPGGDNRGTGLASGEIPGG